MAKKTPVKKSRRRLKRSVRRSLAAVLMVTAIGVAAIPVPENYAVEEGGISTYADEPHIHDTTADDFVYKATGTDIDQYAGSADLLGASKDETTAVGTNGATIDLGKKADKELADLLKDNEVYQSLATTDLGQGVLSLSWQFLFYGTTEPKSTTTQGVICKYNNQYSADELTLNLAPVTEYYMVPEEKFLAYFGQTGGMSHADAMVGMDDFDPTTEHVYKYKQYTGEETSNKSDIDFLEKYCNEEGSDYRQKKQAFEDYKKALEAWDGEGTAPTQPTDFSFKPIDYLDSLEWLSFYCDHDTVLGNYGSGYSLVRVSDGRPKASDSSSDSDGGYIYLARGGTPYEATGRGNDKNGFLYLKTSEYLLCAIGEGAFKGITNVVDLKLPSMISYIGDEAFMDANMMQSIQIDNVQRIGNRAFKNCTSLSNVSMAQGTEIIGAECFRRTAIRSIQMPPSVRTIGYGAFSQCNSLTAVDLNGLNSSCVIKDYAFYNCSAINSLQMDRADITYLGKGAFAVEGGSQPLEIVLPQGMLSTAVVYNTEKKSNETLNSLGDYLFAGRSNLQSVVFPPNYGRAQTPATEIPPAMFHDCVDLQYVEFPATSSDPYACGYLTYAPEKLFKDVGNPDFYVKGPKLNGNRGTASPREATWNAETDVSKTVPYLYVENGVEYYEVSDGYYLLCINKQSGLLTSCTFNPNADVSEWENEGAELVIPATVGNTKVTGIAGNCFSDSQLNSNVISLIIEDDSEIASIADGTFQAGGGDGGNDWKKLEKVYIGNSITSIGNNAFKNCSELVDVTFSSPLGGHEAFTIGTDAFTTQSKKLTFHGDIVEGYAPFKWAMDPDNIIQTEGAIRVCYQSLSPTLLTVMYNPITEMVTLLDYPKFNEISQILKEAHADEIAEGGYRSYEDMKVAEWYARYAGEQYNTDRVDFAKAWSTAADADAKNSLYSTDLYGPWINEAFCRDWRSWINGVPGSGETPGNPDQSEEEEEEEEDDDDSASIGNALIDWLFEPITAYAAEDDPIEDTPLEGTSDPKPYYDIYEYNVAVIVDANDPYRAPTAEEQGLVYYTKNIEIPAGVQSIDVYGYINNLTADGEKSTSLEVNTDNYRLYLRDALDSQSRNMYNTESPADEDGIKSVPGLFSGYYLDGLAAVQETRERGNDVIRSVTMHTVEYLPDYAFDSCEGLTYVILGDACADIGKAPFRGCNSMTTVGDNKYYTTVNGIIYSVNSDGSYTIEECLPARGNLVGQAAVNVSNDENLANVSAIKPGAFEDCDYLTEVDFGQRSTAGLAVIPDDCFKNCDTLQKVVLPMTVNDVGKGAFVGAKNLRELTVYGKEVKISGRAFDGDKVWTTVRAYKDSAVVRYVNEYGDEYKLQYDDQRALGELWQVSFYDYNYTLIEDMKDQLGNDLENPQYVENGSLPTIPQNPANTDEWTFERWVGGNNAVLGEAIYEDTTFYARGYSNSGMVNGKYPVEFWDSLDGQQVGTTQYVEPGGDAIAPGHPVHEGFIEDGFNVPYTNIQAPTTVMMMYKSLNGGGTGTGTGTGSGGSTNTSGQSGSTTGSGSTAGRYTVTVVNGSGSGTYEAGATVIVAANTAPAGMVFQKWTTESSGVTFASVSMAATTFVMPANNVTVTANYVAGSGSASSSGSVSNKNNGTTGSGNGNTRVDILKPGISNKDLATATVNGSTDNFVVKISETDEATRAVTEALMNKYGSLDGILYYAMDISLYDSTGTTKISNTTGLTVDITIPIPDALVAYGGNNMAGAVINGNQLEDLSESFTTINGVPCIRFTATHFSPYTIFVDTGNLTEGMLDTTPKTGDPIHPKWFLSIGLACLSAILFMKKDKAVKVKTA